MSGWVTHPPIYSSTHLLSCVGRRRRCRRRDLELVRATAACFANQRFRGFAHAGATLDPLVHFREIDAELCRVTTRIVEAESIEVSATTRILRLGDDDAIAGLLLAPNT